MKVWIIAWKDIKIRLKDRKGIVLFLFLPILLTAILGTALKGVLADDTNSMPKMTIAVYNADAGEIGARLIEDVLQNEQLAPYITIHSFTSKEEVESQIIGEKNDVGLIIPQDFSRKIWAAESTQLEVLQDQGKPLISQIVRSIVTSYTNRVGAIAQASKEVTTQLTNPKQTAVAVSVNFDSLAAEVLGQLGDAARSEQTFVVDQPIGKKAVSSMQYYAAAMLAMFLLYNATVGAKMIINERSTETLARLMNTPTSKTSILLGKYVGTLAFSILQLLIFMSATNAAFGVNWGENVLQSIVLGLMYAIAVSGLSMMIAAIITNEQAVETISGLGVQILAALGGSMVPIAVFPEFMRKIAHIAPNTWALNGFIDIMSGTTWQALLLPIVVLLAIGTGTLLIGTLRLRYQ
ncbi:ABC transporter permease [Bacillus sp. OK048]|uniref:ABC transporter permease n=1 Tax=Bacillus sp. OK048 TaxID=1882761 RepID=UPI000888ECD8|nr:ABC transporter permease [Bacillus sp. OK048]SDN57953.1 ABC-2 type transport system permease protein [Bacillus sp. OK048]